MRTLDTFDSQRAFRALLDALSHPGRIVPLPSGLVARATPPAVVTALALADLGQSVAVVGSDPGGWMQQLADITDCQRAPADDADQVVVIDGADARLITSLRRGDAVRPELGCRLTLACHSLSTGTEPDWGLDRPVVIGLSGPGVEDTRAVAVTGIPGEVFEALAKVNAEFPAGIDTFLIDDEHQVVGIPRSSTITVDRRTFSDGRSK